MTLKTLICPQCGGQIDNIDETTNKCFCPYCDTIIENVQEEQQKFTFSSQGAVKVSKNDFKIEGGVY